jgi:CRP/FNR family transcriptional regulator
LTNIAIKNVAKQHSAGALKPDEAKFLSRRIGGEIPAFAPPQPLRVDTLQRVIAPNETMTCDVACTICPVFGLLCSGTKRDEAGAEDHAAHPQLSATVHTIPARRLILHPKEWSDFVPIICSGWAMSSVALPDGRRQIISFLLPGDIVSAGSLLAPMSGHTVEAITEVTYRKFRRDEIKELVFKRSDLLEKLFELWNEAKARADQLALDLGRRRADERIARLILRLADKVAKRTSVRSQTFDFPLRQRHIADATGLTPVHVSKVLGELQRAGLIEISSRSLTILNAAELQRVADWR